MTRHAATFAPTGLTRREKRDLQKQISHAQTEVATTRASRRDRSLPEPAVPGPFGPGITQGGYWNLAKAWIPAHQATSQHIAGMRNALSRAGMEAQILYCQQAEALMVNALPVGLGMKL